MSVIKRALCLQLTKRELKIVKGETLVKGHPRMLKSESRIERYGKTAGALLDLLEENNIPFALERAHLHKGVAFRVIFPTVTF